MAAVDFLSVQEDVDSDKIGIIGICGRLTHAYFHLIPLNPLEFGGIFMCWSAVTTLLLIRSSDYLHGTAQPRG